MKVRNGFVSNSSTQSFCIYGAWVDNGPKLDELLKIFEVENAWDLSYDCEDIKNSELDVEVPFEGENGCYIGIPWQNIGDDETGAQFKAKIQKAIKDIFKDSIDVSKLGTHEEAWRDG